ncbi:MAG: C_GCAxxG_C_C family protein [Spirochaetales bacterium]|nr:C_GCAxxG_C_C family protein [Candidatus Physcosoma equi]
MEREDVREHIRHRVHELYYTIDMNCARVRLTCLSETLSVSIGEETMDAALGLHGAGGFRAQCGLVEGALMFLGLYGKRRGRSEKEIVEACYHYGEAFAAAFGSLTCRDLRPGGFRSDDPPHLCETITNKAINFAYDYVVAWLGTND